MIKLVGNELYKLFHKKMIYILSIVFLVLTVGSLILENVLYDSPVLDNILIPTYKQQMETLDLNNKSDAELYVSYKSMVDTFEKVNELGIDYYSTEYYYLANDIGDVMNEAYTAKYVDKDEEKANEYQTKLDSMMAELNNYDWKKYIQQKIDDYKMALQGEMLDSERVVINETIKVLQYRIDNGIPFSNRTGSSQLDEYLASYARYQTMNKDDKAYLNRQDLYEKYSITSAVEEGKYKLEHKLFTNQKSTVTAQSSFVESYSALSIFTMVCILMIAGSIFAEEFNKGTIKQLLTRPYTRVKILTSKIIATCITVLLFMLFTSLVDALAVGVLNGTLGTLNDPIVHYNLSSNSIVLYNTFTDALVHFGAILPSIIILLLFTILVSLLTGQTATSVVLGFILIFIPQLFSLLLDKVRLFSYLPMFNWDLSYYLYGGISPFKYLTFTKAIVVDIVSIIILIVLNIIVFNKKDIKNQ